MTAKPPPASAARDRDRRFAGRKKPLSGGFVGLIHLVGEPTLTFHASAPVKNDAEPLSCDITAIDRQGVTGHERRRIGE